MKAEYRECLESWKKKKVETSSERKPELEWSFSILESIKRLWLSDINHVVSTEQ